MPTSILTTISLFSSLYLGVSGQTFSAAPKAAHIQRRDLGLTPRHNDLELYFTDGGHGSSDTTPLAVKVTLEPHHPTLILEDVGHLFDTVSCDGDMMHVNFATAEQAMLARREWTGVKNLTMVSSSTGCAPAGKHQAYRLAPTHHEDETLVSFMAELVSLKDSSHRMSVEVGSYLDEHIHRPARINARSPSPQTATQSSATTAVASTTSKITGSPTAIGDIGFSFLEQQVIPFTDNEFIQANIDNQLPSLQFINLTCLNCTSAGVVKLVGGGFNVSDGIIEIAQDIDNHGFFKFNTSGVHANMSLELDLLAGLSIEFTPKFPVVALPPFVIPGIVELELGLFAGIPLGVVLNSNVTVQTGFTVDVPDNSTIYLDIGNSSNSFAQGFSNATLTPLPLNVNADNLSFSLLAGFEPTLALTALTSTGAVSAKGEIKALLDVPLLNTTITSLHNVSGTCDTPQGNDTVVESALRVENGLVFDAKVSANLSILVDIGVDTADINLGPKFGREKILLETSINSLPSQCLKLDKAGGGLIAATATPASASGSGGTATPTSAASTILAERTSTLNAMLGMVGAVVFGYLI